jgi:signal transduction histidine kinase
VQIVKELFSESKETGEKQRTLVLEVKGEAEELQADYSLIRYIFSNMLGNSIKFSEAGTEVKVILDYEKEDLEISFVDQGIGIPEEDQSKVFQSFYRGSNVSNVQGTGVGLSIVSEFVKLHKGKIKLVSAAGKGSTFTLTLPKL